MDVAYHSPHMNEVAAKYSRLIQGIKRRENREGQSHYKRPMTISSVTGAKISDTELCTTDYWVKNMVSPVRFCEALSLICASSKSMKKKIDGSHRNTILVQDLLEVEPHSALQRSIREILAASSRGVEISYDAMLIRNTSALVTTFSAIARLHCSGYLIDIDNVNRLARLSGKSYLNELTPLVLTDLPEYPFDHSQTYWYESRLSTAFRFRPRPRLDLLGTPVPDWNPLEPRWRHTIRVSELPWVEDRKVSWTYGGLTIILIEVDFN